MDGRIYDRPSEVSAEEGVVHVEGPDSVSIQLTPEAAEETSHRLLDGAVEAKGQERMGKQPAEKPNAARD